MLSWLKQANCQGISIGIESGSEKIRKEVLNRLMTNEQIIRAFSTAKEAGLAVSSFNMVGIPFETRMEIQETITLNRKIRPNMVAVSTFTPYPGTQLRDSCQQKGWIKDCDIPSTYIPKSIMNYPNVSVREISWWRKTFRFKVLIKSNINKAFMSLVFDMLYEVLLGLKRGTIAHSPVMHDERVQ
ncbi:B12-binding domain-containing radical SAM protein [Chloroflexota bacterium]